MRSYTTLNPEALLHNDNLITQLVGENRGVITMLKGNAYGHGLEQVAMTLRDRRNFFGVATLDEAMQLRHMNPAASIMVMSGFSAPDEISSYIEHRLIAVVHSEEQVQWLSDSKTQPPGVQVWMKIDMGMHRLGFLASNVDRVHEKLSSLQKTGHVNTKPMGLLAHLPDATDTDRSETLAILSAFRKLTEKYPGPKSAGHSPVISEYPEALQGWARPGGILYGMSLFPGKSGADYGFQPVMSLHSKLLEIKTLVRGDRIGYGGTYTCPESMRIGVVAMGYADGYPQQAPSGVPMLVRGQCCPLVGRVSMDFMSVDLRASPEACVGDDVILWGDSRLPIETVAERLGMVPYALPAMLTERVKRIARIPHPVI